MSHSKIDLALKAAIGALLCALGWVVVTSMQERVVEVGDVSPKFAITTDQGLRVSRDSFGGKVLVLNFWATWCAPCVEEVPSLDQFQRAVADSGVVVVGVSVDKNPKSYANFLKRFRVAFQTARDPEANISSDFGTFKYPETYIIDRTGRVVQKIIGPRNWNDPEIINYVKSL